MDSANGRLDRIEGKIDKLSEHLSNMDVTLAAQHISLENHIRRTELLEAQVIPMKKRYDTLNGVIKGLTVLGGLAAGILAILKLYKAI